MLLTYITTYVRIFCPWMITPYAHAILNKCMMSDTEHLYRHKSILYSM